MSGGEVRAARLSDVRIWASQSIATRTSCFQAVANTRLSDSHQYKPIKLTSTPNQRFINIRPASEKEDNSTSLPSKLALDKVVIRPKRDYTNCNRMTQQSSSEKVLLGTNALQPDVHKCVSGVLMQYLAGRASELLAQMRFQKANLTTYYSK